MLTFLSPSEYFAAICHFRLLFASLLPLSLVENSLKEQFQLSCEQIEAADHKLNIGQDSGHSIQFSIEKCEIFWPK